MNDFTVQQNAWFSIMYNAKHSTTAFQKLPVEDEKIMVIFIPYGLGKYAIVNCECVNEDIEILIEIMHASLLTEVHKQTLSTVVDADLDKFIEYLSTGYMTDEEALLFRDVMYFVLSDAYGVYHNDRTNALQSRKAPDRSHQLQSTMIDNINIFTKQLSVANIAKNLPINITYTMPTSETIEHDGTDVVFWTTSETLGKTKPVCVTLKCYTSVDGKSYHLMTNDGAVDIALNKVTTKRDLLGIYETANDIFNTHKAILNNGAIK